MAPGWGPGTQPFRLEGVVAELPNRFGRGKLAIYAIVLAHWRAGQPIVDDYYLVPNPG